jgi:hypothetical protein
MKNFPRLVTLDPPGVLSRKAPSVNVTVHILPRVCWIGWYLVVHIYAFTPTICHQMIFWFMVKQEAENIIKAGLEDYQWRFESMCC